MASSNGSWNGRDPRLRLLRTIAFFVILVLFAYVVVDKDARDVATLGTLAGMLLIFGGFEAGLRWPVSSPPSPPPVTYESQEPTHQYQTPVEEAVENEWDAP